MKLQLIKMQGAGNDFLLIDALKTDSPLLHTAAVQFLCDRHFGVGADGLIILKPSQSADLEWDFWNSDGSVAEMCGNGARCVIRYVSERWDKERITLKTLAGIVSGRYLGNSEVEVSFFKKPTGGFEYKEHILKTEETPITCYSISTGVPHAVIEVRDIRSYPIVRIGQWVHDHAAFAPQKTNVTFFQKQWSKEILSTTFERGVEQETFACGTGAVAAAIVYSELYNEKLPMSVHVPGGTLVVDLQLESQHIVLQGPAVYVMETELEWPTEISERKILYSERRRK